MFSRIAVILVMLVGFPAIGQWQKISIPEIENNPRVRAVTYKAGALWVATQDTLRMTTDDGASWHVRIPDDSGAMIQAIDFFDDKNGVLTTKRYVWRTTDGGMSWDTIYSHNYHFPQNQSSFTIKFIRSPLEIVFGTNDSCHVYVTRNGGKTWDSTDFHREDSPLPADTAYYDFRELKDIQTSATGTIRVLLLRKSSGGSCIATSRDYGKSWKLSSGFDYDCYSFAVDFCDTNIFYVINEEVFESWRDRTAMFYRSSDAGASWQSYYPTSDLNYFTGSLGISPGSVIYLQTSKEGILRSPDNGNYWQKIGGPNGRPDTRLLFALSDDIVYVAGSDGTVWKTENAGGFPGGNQSRTRLITSKAILFSGANASICGDTLIDTLILSYPECPPIVVDTAVIESVGDYSIIYRSRDTIIVRFVPKAPGKRYAELVLTLNSTSRQVIPLAGWGYIPDFTFSPTKPAIFTSDSILFCDTVVCGIRIRTEGCIVPDVLNQSITGIAINDYKILTPLPRVLTGDDSITIAFAPRVRGLRSAVYSIRFANNKIHTVPLAGYGIDPGPSLSKNRAALFDIALVPLCTSSSDTVVITSNICVGRFVDRQSFTGAYASEYRIEHAITGQLKGLDTIIISFTPQAAGPRPADFEIVASDSSQITIPLQGRAFDGGYTFTADKSSLFDADTASMCGDTIERQFVINIAGCVLPNIASEVITGSQAYTLLKRAALTANDTVIISFTPSAEGLHNAAYELTLTDGKKLILPLRAVGSAATYSLSIMPQLLFDSDSLFLCESVERTIGITKEGCTTVRISRSVCDGNAASDYRIVTSPTDTLLNGTIITIVFEPSAAGSRDATYSLTLTDGSIITVPLSGYGRAPIALSLATEASFVTDTLGDIINVPIAIRGLDIPQSIELSLTFDANLEYLGSRSLAGVPLDIPGEIRKNSSRLRIPGSEIRLNDISAYTDFKVFADSGSISTVKIADLILMGNPLPCKYLINSEAAISMIEGPQGCVVTILSDFLRYSKFPDVRIYPNPAREHIIIETSDDVGISRAEIIDRLGTVQQGTYANLLGARPVSLNITGVASGFYFIRLIGNGFATNLPLIIER